MNDLINAKEKLISGGYTCVICKGEKIYTSVFRGVKPLVAWYADDMDFTGYSAADKVVGRATAFLYVLLNVKALYTGVISKPALAYLQENNIKVEYDTLVENIINRQGDGMCPFEKTVLDINDKQQAYTAIRKKMEEMGISL